LHLLRGGFMLQAMDELDEFWSHKLDEAIANAHKSGRSDVAEYLTLKATNDAIRQTSVQWLFGALIEIASSNPFVKIESETAHRFDFAKANMVGSLLRLRQGVRCLTLEAGWTRTPADGFMRGGALAAARISHFGMAKQNADLILLRSSQETPQWFSIDDDNVRSVFNSHHLQTHFAIFLK
jgi:hypothetical protein